VPQWLIGNYPETLGAEPRADAGQQGSWDPGVSQQMTGPVIGE
jgi:hypothetical protein